jgi:hypothetical protein
MRATAVLACLVLPLTLALAETRPPEPSPEQRLQQFRRDRELIQGLVRSGLRLAAEDDPLRRADYCNRVAEDLADEIQRAVSEKDRGRATDLGLHLQAVLVRGVAGNLKQARSTLPPDSPGELKVRSVGEDLLRSLKPLQDKLDRAPAQDQETVQPLLQAVSKGRAEVEAVIRKGPARQGNGTGKKGPPAGKRPGASRK